MVADFCGSVTHGILPGSVFVFFWWRLVVSEFALGRHVQTQQGCLHELAKYSCEKSICPLRYHRPQCLQRQVRRRYDNQHDARTISLSPSLFSLVPTTLTFQEDLFYRLLARDLLPTTWFIAYDSNLGKRSLRVSNPSLPTPPDTTFSRWCCLHVFCVDKRQRFPRRGRFYRGVVPSG